MTNHCLYYNYIHSNLHGQIWECYAKIVIIRFFYAKVTTQISVLIFRNGIIAVPSKVNSTY